MESSKVDPFISVLSYLIHFQAGLNILGLWIVRQVAIRSTIHELLFTDRTASHWFIEK